MKKNLIIVLGIICLSSISGCATIVNDSKQKVAVHTTPSGATVSLDGQQQTSSAIFNVKGSSGYNVVANKKGYKPANAHIDGSFRFGSVIFGNILWLIPGLIIDLATGAAYEMQNEVTIPMQKIEE